MSTFVLTCMAILAFILTLWLVIIPAGVLLVGAFAALSRGGHEWKWWGRHHHPHPS